MSWRLRRGAQFEQVHERQGSETAIPQSVPYLTAEQSPQIMPASLAGECRGGCPGFGVAPPLCCVRVAQWGVVTWLRYPLAARVVA